MNLNIPWEITSKLIKILGRNNVLILASIENDDPSMKQACVIIGDEEFYIDRNAIVLQGKRY